MIQVKNVSKIYNQKVNPFTALDNVSLEIPKGETVAIIGKSGSGKSTLMHIISGLDHPTSGIISVNNTVLHAMKPKQMDSFRANEMSFIFQSFFVEANQTCFQNVMLPLEIANVSRKKRRKMVEVALTAVGLMDKIDALAANLSGGQKQRLAIARAIVNRPKLIFADEPTGNLDSSTGDKIIKLLFNLNKKLNCTLMIVTHDDELAQHCNMQINLKDGKVQSVRSKSRKGIVR